MDTFSVEHGDGHNLTVTRDHDGTVVIDPYGDGWNIHLNSHDTARFESWITSDPLPPTSPSCYFSEVLDLTGRHTRIVLQRHGNTVKGPWSIYVTWRGMMIYGRQFSSRTLQDIMSAAFNGLVGAYHVIEALKGKEEADEIQEAAEAITVFKRFGQQDS